jgi:CheY-like chemotaxis protein
MSAILIVDDEYGLAEILMDLLTAQGHTVTTAINGKLAMESLARMRPDVIVADVMMPIMAGDAMVHELKRAPALRDIPVILMSAAGFDDLDAELRPLISGFLHKPFTFSDLLSALARALPAR